jgi:hypothetical protein
MKEKRNDTVGEGDGESGVAGGGEGSEGEGKKRGIRCSDGMMIDL